MNMGATLKLNDFNEGAFRFQCQKVIFDLKINEILNKSERCISINPNLGGGGEVKFYPLSWFSLNNSEMVQAVTLEFCSIQ